MRRLALLLAVLFIAAIPANAQDSYPTAEVFVGYSYLSFDLNIRRDREGPIDFDEREGFHGVGFSVAGNLSPVIGIVGDFSYNKREIELPGDDLDLSNLVFLFGPRFSSRGDSITGFGHALVGGTRVKTEGFRSDTGFTLGFGAGLDINVGRRVAVRLGQVDYLPTRLNGDWHNNLRFQIGLVVKAGEGGY